MDQIEIRLYQKRDINGFYAAVMESKDAVSKWLPWCDDNYSKTDTIHWIQTKVPLIWASKKGCEFVIVNSKNNKILGGCCLEQIDLIQKEASLAYWVRTSETHKGVAVNACRFLLKYGFETLGLKSIRVIPSAENIASIKVAEKLPYEHLQIVPNGFQIRDTISDALVYNITRDSYYNKSF